MTSSSKLAAYAHGQSLQWTTYLKNLSDGVTPNGSDSKSSLFEFSSTFFSPPGLVDFFGIASEGDFKLITNIQSTFTNEAQNTMTTLESLANTGALNELFAASFFNNSTFYSTADIANTSLSSISKSLALDIENMSYYKSDDIGSMQNLMPQYRNLFETLEYHCIEDDGSLTEALFTPDVKLYYPEPFIASPSFVHEDL